MKLSLTRATIAVATIGTAVLSAPIYLAVRSLFDAVRPATIERTLTLIEAAPPDLARSSTLKQDNPHFEEANKELNSRASLEEELAEILSYGVHASPQTKHELGGVDAFVAHNPTSVIESASQHDYNVPSHPVLRDAFTTSQYLQKSVSDVRGRPRKFMTSAQRATMSRNELTARFHALEKTLKNMQNRPSTTREQILAQELEIAQTKQARDAAPLVHPRPGKRSRVISEAHADIPNTSAGTIGRLIYKSAAETAVAQSAEIPSVEANLPHHQAPLPSLSSDSSVDHVWHTSSSSQASAHSSTSFDFSEMHTSQSRQQPVPSAMDEQRSTSPSQPSSPRHQILAQLAADKAFWERVNS